MPEVVFGSLMLMHVLVVITSIANANPTACVRKVFSHTYSANNGCKAIKHLLNKMTMRSLSLLFLALLHTTLAFSPDSFSLSAYQKARALETSNSLDASRLHFQILFVDDDNAKGRIAEGLLARIAEHNDGVCVLFPASATLEHSRNAPRDAAAPDDAVQICAQLFLDETIATAIGTSFDLRYLDEYDLVVCLTDDIRSLILRSMPQDHQDYYAPKCRLLAEFLSPAFCSTSEGCTIHPDQLLDMLEPDLRERAEPKAMDVMGRSSNVFCQPDEAGAAMILATAGIARFSLDTIDSQFDSAFDHLLEKNFGKQEHLDIKWDQADAQLRRCSYAITGYFSPQQRKTKFERHMVVLRSRLSSQTESNED